jgi:hypothetical protein
MDGEESSPSAPSAVQGCRVVREGGGKRENGGGRGRMEKGIEVLKQAAPYVVSHQGAT